MKAVKIKENIYWVGGIDWSLRNFHGYLTQKGSTYNAYLIIDEKITLIDTVKSYLADEMISRISSVIDPSKIDYIVSNHVEMDHSGGLPAIKEIAKDAKIFTSPNGARGLAKHYNQDWKFEVIKSGDTLNLGKNNLNFVLTPMVHWPDNMVEYLPEEKILFSNDGFGQHLATSERFDDDFPIDIIEEEAKKYYANIVMPYGMQVQKELEEAAKLDIEMICPSHGIIWRKNIKIIVDNYVKWSANEFDKKALIIYDTMWGSTEKMARTILGSFEEKGYKVVLLDLQANHISDVITEVLEAEYICVGSPTLNNTILPTVASFLTYLKGLAPKGRKAVAFGSFGWGGQSVGEISGILENAGFELVDSYKQQYLPTKENLEEIKAKLIEKI